ncbi:MAG: FG-GAP-like repeat-containing protein [Candidatus Manganitrophus sp. SA1]|nr:FG-GAP-like repeat-containing protein [Candidatus Manganitrophus morganii]
MRASWRRWLSGWVVLFGLVVFAPLVYGQVSPPVGGKGSVAGNSGDFTTSIPIEVPPGRNGLTPQLSLVYNSSDGDGFLGAGWDLPIDSISRNTKYGVNYNCDTSIADCFVSSTVGELIRRPDWCSECYGAKIEGAFMRFRLVDGLYWEVIDKSGTKYFFGQTAASRQDGVPGVFNWMLSTVTDTRNNSITYTYYKNQGEIYIDRIDYQQNSIIFYREGLTDAAAHYIPTFAVTTAHHLKTIDVLANDSRVRTYKLAYTPSESSARSRLESVQQFGKNAIVNTSTGTITNEFTSEKLPAITFVSAPNDATVTWTAHSAEPWPGYSEVGTVNSSNLNWISADVNGDGRTDLVHVYYNYLGVQVRTLRSDPGGIWTPQSQDLWPGYTENYTVDSSTLTWMPMDVDADGRTDLVHVYYLTSNNVQVRVLRSNGDGTWTAQSQDTWPGFTNRGSGALLNWLPADVNGDGKTDLVHAYPNSSGIQIHTLISNGNGTWTPQSHDPWPGFSESGVLYPDSFVWMPADVNGDGKTDLVHVYYLISNNVQVRALLSNGNGWTPQSHDAWPGFDTINSPSNTRYWMPADVNGDGRTDLVHFRYLYPGIKVYTLLSNGNGQWTNRTHDNAWPGFTNTGTGALLNWMPTDVDKDGKTDLVHIYYANPDTNPDVQVHTLLSNGNGTWINRSQDTWPGFTNSGAGNLLTWMPADVDGSGKMDLVHLYHMNPGVQVHTLLSSGPLPNTLTSISNGIGGKTTIAYQPSSAFWSSSDTRWYLPFVTQNVYTITACPNYSGSSCTPNMSLTTEYDYEGAYYNTPAREFRGFWSVREITPLTSTETLYHHGSGVSVAPDVPGDPYFNIGYTAHQPFQIAVRDTTGVVRSQKTFTYWSDADGAAPWFAPLKQAESSVCDSPTNCKTSQSIYTYDDTFKDMTYTGVYGNLTKEEHKADLSNPSDFRRILHGYKPNISSWIVGLPAYERTTDEPGAIRSATVFHYDGAQDQGVAPTIGNLTQVGRWYKEGQGSGCDNVAGPGACFFTTMTYDTYGNLLTSTDANQRQTIFRYDTSTTFPATFLQCVTNAKGHVTRMDYYGVTSWNSACGSAPVAYSGAGFYGQVKSITDSNDQQILMSYDALGRKAQVTDPNGEATAFFYNSGSVGSQNVQTNTTSGFFSLSYFDGFGRTITEKKIGPVINGTLKTIRVDTTYNNLGQVTSATLPYFDGDSTNGSTTFEYNDLLGRQTKIIGADNSKTLFCYSLWSVATVDASGHLRQETRDGHGRLAKVDEYSGTFGITSCPTIPTPSYAATLYNYDFFGNLAKVTDAANNITTMRYDSLSRKMAMSDPDMGNCGDLTALNPQTSFPWYPNTTPSRCWNYKYDAIGNLIEQWNARTVNQKTFFRYDEINRLIQKDYGTQKPANDPTADVRYSYDAAPAGFTSYPIGRLSQVIDVSGTVKSGYDKMGRTNRTDKIVDNITYTTQTGYDVLGRVVSVSYPDGDVVYYSYNVGSVNTPFLTQVYKDSSVFYAQYSDYNALGQPGTVLYGNGVKTTYTYLPNNFRLSQICTIGPASTTPCVQADPAVNWSVFQKLGYTYDKSLPGVGNVTKINDSIATRTYPQGGVHIKQLQDFDYDVLDRLTSAIAPDSYGTIAYDYNQIGNMTCNTKISSCSPTNYTYPASGASSVRPHAVSTAGASSYFYDANGNMTCNSFLSSCSSSTPNLVYDYEDRLVTFSGGSTPTNFIYDGDGGRVKKVRGAVTKIYIGKLFECFAICYGSGTWNNGEKHIFAGSARIASKPVGNTGDISYFHTNHLGSTSVITDKNGNNIAEFAYLPFGDSYPADNQAAHYKYTGQERDVETGLYFYNSRYYDARLGRFTQADTIVPSPRDPQALNRYSYVRNNPIIYIDPTGHGWLKNTKKFLNRAVKRNAAVGIITQAVFPVAGTYLLSKSDQGMMVLQGQVVVGSIALGPAGYGASAGWMAAYSGATAAGMTALAGGDFGDALKAGVISAGIGYGSGLVSGGVKSIATPWIGSAAGNILGAGAGGYTAGAGTTLAYGGNLSQAHRAGYIGAGAAAGAAALNELYRSFVPYDVDLSPGYGSGAKENGGVIKGANNVGNARTMDEILHNVGLDLCYEGSACSEFANQIGGINAVGGFHDMLFPKTGLPFNPVTNWGTMIPAGAITYGAAMSGSPVNQLIVDMNRP